MTRPPEAASWSQVRDLFDEVADLSPEARQSRLAQETDPSLVEQVRGLLAADAEAGPLADAPTWGGPVTDLSFDLAAGTVLGPWTIDGVLGRGGMGTVYAAHRSDGAFDRRAAIKLIRGVAEIPALRARFEDERRLLAGLDHPGIARLLDAGTSPGGLPYLVLERVDGEPIDAYCERRGLELGARIRLFLEACEAVSFAHQNLVLHRDLKPSNLLVDAAGRTKLLDFGIAKLLDPETGAERDATRAAGALGRPLTPAYASPEQLRGENLSTASDVWSLGVLLHRLLTGVLPFAERDDESAVERATRLTSERPSTPRRSDRVDQDLAAILSTALAPERARRYGTVAELADDLRRYLDRQPVRARPPSASYRARRFFERHRLAVAVAASMIAVLTAATVFSLRQAAIAGRERDAAHARFEDVRRLAKVFVFDVHDAVARLPGSLETRAMLVQTGLEYFDRLAADEGGDLAVAAELAAGYERLGELQGRPSGAQRGDTTGAAATLDKACAIRRRLVAASHPKPVEASVALAGCELVQAEIQFALGERERGVELARGARGRIESIAVGHPGREFLLGRLLHVEGWLEALGGDLTVSLSLLARAVELLESSAPETASPRERMAVIKALLDLGAVVGNAGGDDALDRALGHMERARSLAAELERADPGDPEALRLLARSYALIGSTHSVAMRDPQALLAFQEQLRLAERLASRDPADFEAARSLAKAREGVGEMLAAMGRPREGIVQLEPAVAWFEAAMRREPENVRVATNFISAAANLAEILDQLGRRPEGCAWWHKAAAVAEPMLQRKVLMGTELEATEETVRRAKACGD